MNRLIHALFALVLAASTACGPSGTSSTEATSDTTAVTTGVKESNKSGRITIAVDETFRPVIESEIETFQATYPEAEINALYLPGEDAIQQMLDNDTIRLVISTRTLGPDEEAYLRQEESRARASRIATDAIAFIMHEDNPVNRLATSEVEQILTGEITTWQELGADGIQGPIQIVFDNSQSSTVQFVKDSILPGLELTTENIAAGKTNPEVIEYVSATPNALGIIGVSWISDQDDDNVIAFLNQVKVLGLVPAYECSFSSEYASFQPYQAFIKVGCYPYNRGVFAILRESFFGLGSGFVAYLASDPGQRIIHKAGLVPETGITRLVKFPSKYQQEQ